jgi:dihydrofolate reductase
VSGALRRTIGCDDHAAAGRQSAHQLEPLVDELHLFVYPVAIGHGQRLFPDGAPRAAMTLSGCEAFDSGVVHLTYQPAVD